VRACVRGGGSDAHRMAALERRVELEHVQVGLPARRVQRSLLVEHDKRHQATRIARAAHALRHRRLQQHRGAHAVQLQHLAAVDQHRRRRHANQRFAGAHRARRAHAAHAVQAARPLKVTQRQRSRELHVARLRPIGKRGKVDDLERTCVARHDKQHHSRLCVAARTQSTDTRRNESTLAPVRRAQAKQRRTYRQQEEQHNGPATQRHVNGRLARQQIQSAIHAAAKRRRRRIRRCHGTTHCRASNG